MDQVCANETFFNLTEFLSKPSPDFSECFQQVVLRLAPCVFLWLFSIPVYLSRRASIHCHIPPSNLYRLKLVVTFLMKMMSLIDVVYSTYEYASGKNPPLAHIFSPGLFGFSMVLIMMMLRYDRKKGIITSGILSCFWFICVLLWALIMEGKIQSLLSEKGLEQGQLIRCVTSMISFVGAFAHLIMSFFVDGPRSGLDKDPFLKEEETNGFLQQSRGAKVCPEKSSTFWARTSFSWFDSMIWYGYKRPIAGENLWKLNDEDKSARVSRHFLRYWKEESKLCGCNKPPVRPTNDDDDAGFGSSDVLIQQPSGQQASKPSLFRALRRTFGPYFYPSIVLKILNDCLQFASPQLLSALIAFNEGSSPVWQGYTLALLMFLAACLQSVILNQYFHVCFKSGMRVRSAITNAVYRKALSLSNAARKQATAGEVVNLMSVDAQKLQDMLPYLNTVWSGPFQILVALAFLYNILGNSVFAGLAVMVLLVPLNGFIAKKAFKLQSEQMKLKDERIKIMSEILSGIKLLKMYAWETSFMDKVTQVRKKETSRLKTGSYLMAVATLTWSLAPFAVTLVTFAVYVLTDPTHVLTPQKAFVSLALFDLLRFPIIMIPIMISSLVEARVSLRRLEQFLCHDELDRASVERRPRAYGGGDEKSPAVRVSRATFGWNRKDESAALKNIEMEVREGELVAVVGQVGCGKSSLISAILGDMEKFEGHVSLKGSTAYVPQQAWIQNMSARQNIVFGSAYNEERYQRTVRACALVDDFAMLPAGDRTEIGERGINLSGGQKQRLSIARSVYQDLDVYLLDDPLSAVDAHVGRKIFDEVIGPRGMLRHKTRVLVTHAISFLPEVDRVLVMGADGTIEQSGTYSALLEREGAFADFLRTYNQENDDDGGDLDDSFDRQADPSSIAKKRRRKSSSNRSKSESENPVGAKKKIVQEEDERLMTEETAESGNIKLKDVALYMRALGYHVVFALIFNLTLQNASSVASGLWLSAWSSDPIDPVTGAQNSTMYRLAVYGGFGAAQAVSLLFGSLLLTYGSVAAAVQIHRRMLYRIIRAPMSFFDTTPLGRIINRFSKDVYLIDQVVPHDLHDFLWTFFSVLATIFVISYSFPLFLAAIVPILLLYYLVQRVYVKTSRQLQRIESVRRSPIYSHFGESLNGASSIRAYNLEEAFIKENEDKMDDNQAAYYPNIVSNRWLALRVTVVGSLIVFFAALLAVIERGRIASGLVGLSITYAIETTQVMNWLVRQASSLETNIVSVERVEEYSNIEQEAELRNTKAELDEDWPREGAISYQSYATRYRSELDLVVDDVTLHIGAGEKIGVVGRTGAGKSSLTLALFRIVEAAKGRICIDDVDISTMGLHDLRSKIAIIPQDPILFSGTLRMNLDPFGKYSDDQLWEALEHSHLKSFVAATRDKLQHEVAEGGDNLSVGQRQLVCLARALLKNSKILVLDEATAAVDFETDALIQATIREKFSSCTVFTIAHRLNTIMDSDRIAVLDAGRLVQLDTPEKLLQDKSNIFYSMAKHANLI